MSGIAWYLCGLVGNGPEVVSLTKWEPLSFLEPDTTESFALIILNQPILIKKEIMVHLWNKSVIRLTVDGGTDRWFEWLQGSEVCGLINSGLPDLVTGDLDSIGPNTLTVLQEKSVTVDVTPNQDLTDFSKAVQCLKDRSTVTDKIIVICEVSGRLDHILSQLNTLHKYEESIILLSSNSATWLLQAGKHEINVANLRHDGILSPERWIGLIPVGASTVASTSGLKWNLNETEMKFGGLISSSNTYSDEAVIKIAADKPLIWSMGLSLSEKTGV